VIEVSPGRTVRTELREHPGTLEGLVVLVNLVLLALKDHVVRKDRAELTVTPAQPDRRALLVP